MTTDAGGRVARETGTFGEMNLQVSKDGEFWMWVAYLPSDPDMAEVRAIVGPWAYWRIIPRDAGEREETSGE